MGTQTCTLTLAYTQTYDVQKCFKLWTAWTITRLNTNPLGLLFLLFKKISMFMWSNICVKITVLLDEIPCSLAGVYWCLEKCVVSIFSSTLKFKAAHFFKLSVNTHHTTWHYIPQDSNLYSHHHENLKSYTNIYCHTYSFYN